MVARRDRAMTAEKTPENIRHVEVRDLKKCFRAS